MLLEINERIALGTWLNSQKPSPNTGADNHQPPISMLTPDDKLADLRRREYGTAKQIAGIEAKIIRLRAAFSARTTAITNLRREIALLEGQPAPKRHELRPGY